ncbi:85cdf562-f45b-45db-9785-5f16b4bb7273 [Thermothielavioides terrestris]|uniref:85cdf562-f45b-45db-9785-5f16b4bb7273 n=1 Tax=Thermothielavioides terrestris TaxID=2587410 RepID=A0A3S4F7G6_9PEZI|nr:85cdf562-f45b-45db-9785-5f16b4bb7273 [Thermothielavioides terrestris]
MATDFGGLYIGNAILYALWIIPLVVLWFISLCSARRKGDPARGGVSWLKATYPIWIIASILYLVVAGVRAAQYYDHHIDPDTSFQFDRAVTHTAITANFFENVANILLFVTLVELASGFLYCLSGGQPPSIRKFSRIAVLAWGLVLFGLSIGLFGFDQSTAVSFYRAAAPTYGLLEEDFLSFVPDEVAIDRLGGAVDILMWITSIPVLAYSAYVVHRTKTNPVLRSAAILLLVANILNFIRLLFTMAIDAAAFLSDPTRAVIDGDMVPAAVGIIVEPLFDVVPMFVLLVLLFALTIRKAGGLWSRPQPGWTPYVVAPYPAVVPVAYAPQQQQQQAGGVPVQAAPVPMQMAPQPGQPLPAYLQVAQQKAWQQQQQQQQQAQQQPQQGGFYYPAQPQQPAAQPQPQQQQPQP